LHAADGLAGLVAGLLLALGIAATPAHGETLRTGGTGAAVGVLEQLGKAFSTRNPDISLAVVPGLGSSGAISAVIDGALDFAVAGRPLKPEEAAEKLTSMVLARTPFGLASSYPRPGNIDSPDIAAFFLNPAATWADGTKLRVILRPRSEADTTLLRAAFPGMDVAIDQLRQRREIPVATTDQDNAQTAEQISGSLTGMSLTQMVTEAPKLSFLTIDGVEPSLENLQSGSYPYAKNLTFVFRAPIAPTVARFIAFLRSPEGEAILHASGNLAATP